MPLPRQFMSNQTNTTRLVIALGSAQTLAWGSTYYLPAILAAPMARDLDLSVSLVFGAFSAALVVSAVLGPFAGRRIDIFGGRGVLAASSLIFALGLVLLGAANGAATLFAAWLIIGAGMAMGLYEAAFSTLAAIYGTKARGAITGITLLAGFASTVCWPVSAYLEAEAGWRAACFFWAAAHILIGLPLNFWRVPSGSFALAGPVREDRGMAADAATAMRERTMLLLAFIFAVTWFISTAMAAHMPGLLQAAGATPAAAIAAAALIGPAQVAGRIAEFGLIRRLHPVISARAAAAAHPLGAIALLVFGAPAAMLFTVLHGAGNGILTIAKGTLPLAIYGPGGYGFRQGILMAPARFGQALAPFLFALLLERYGASALLVSTGLGVAALAALFALAVSRHSTGHG